MSSPVEQEQTASLIGLPDPLITARWLSSKLTGFSNEETPNPLRRWNWEGYRYPGSIIDHTKISYFLRMTQIIESQCFVDGGRRVTWLRVEENDPREIIYTLSSRVDSSSSSWPINPFIWPSGYHNDVDTLRLDLKPSGITWRKNDDRFTLPNQLPERRIEEIVSLETSGGKTSTEWVKYLTLTREGLLNSQPKQS